MSTHPERRSRPRGERNDALRQHEIDSAGLDLIAEFKKAVLLAQIVNPDYFRIDSRRTQYSEPRTRKVRGHNKHWAFEFVQISNNQTLVLRELTLRDSWKSRITIPTKDDDLSVNSQIRYTDQPRNSGRAVHAVQAMHAEFRSDITPLV